MPEPETIHLFSYGTLRLPEVQMAVFGRLIEGVDDALPGWRTEMVEITDPDVLAKSGERFHPITIPSTDPADAVAGSVFRVTEADLWAADAYEVSDYVRTCVRLRSGLAAWTYVKADEAPADPPLSALIAAEQNGLALLDAIEAAGFIAPGRAESAIEADIRALAARDFGVSVHWHDRVVRTGINTLCIAGQPAPDRIIEEDDIVFLDLGPVFGDWEADVGRSYAVGNSPEKRRLVADLETVFDVARARFLATPDITGADLFAIAVAESEARGWRFGGQIAGHTVGPFPYARSPAGKTGGRVNPANTQRMRDPDQHGRPRHWILEIHLVSPDGQWGGFYERLLLED
ncbi:M24 family metallopeptidase [Sphingomonas crocodyli]|uniref:M24 family metallopeptidase n=1 Tax=Sphingomonas crocodyli TaxID=1979270 RepID=A0A437MB15_9SPHN|nr:M24 family metallopeptidase [Sphingomonas crocodyli]RVT94837.1 M24 family metallopeptidase [Sphingomonas crocodyli]